MSIGDKTKTVRPGGVSRRRFLQGASIAAAAVALPAMPRQAFAAGEDVIRVGFISPQSGPIGIFGEGDPYVMDLVRKTAAEGIDVAGKRFGVEFISRDTQSDPVRAAQVAKDLINGENIDLMLSTSTPETVNPVADACEAAGVPSLSATSPWEAFYFGRGAKPGEPSPFKWTYHFCFGVGNFATLYADQWNKVETNRRVGVLLPSDADGNAIRGLLLPELEKAGFTIVDAGPYENGNPDFSTQINLFRNENCEIFNTFPFPPDFAVFWRQAAQKGYAQTVKICQMAKAGLFAPELEALGSLGYGLHAGAYWHKAYPFRSASTGMSSLELADGFEAWSGKQWNQQVGATAALFDAAIAAIASASNPKDKPAMAAALAGLKAETACGPIDFTNGPVANCTPIGVVGVQWVKAPAGSKHPFELEIVSNADHPLVSTTAEMTAYRLEG
jgi:branched-chain amino acid transport system substrate-binding protein